MPSSTRTAKSERIIARYLTVGGATVDITETGPRDSVVLQVTVAACGGCPAEQREQWRDGFYDYSYAFHPVTREDAVARAEKEAREWAQSHAEKCRALPRPTA
jgi:hypothetical protein